MKYDFFTTIVISQNLFILINLKLSYDCLSERGLIYSYIYTHNYIIITIFK